MARAKSTQLTACMRLLVLIKETGPRTVVAADLIEAGIAVECGYAWAEDDYEGPKIYLTQTGKIAAERS